MSLLFPRVAFAPVRCAPIRHEVAPLWSLFDETFSQLERASRRSRQQFHPSFDVKEAKDSYLVEGELPGFNPKDLSIEFLDDGHTLQIKGHTETRTENGTAPQALETEQTKASLPEVTSEATSEKLHRASVEDEVEEPANSSAVNAEATTASETTEPKPQEVVPTQQPKEPEFKQWIAERYTGEFSRSFKFPSRVNQEAVKASLKDGILSITLPFAEKPASRHINIE